MRSTVNVKVSFVLPLFCFFVVSYIAYLLIDYNVQHTNWRKNFGLTKREMATRTSFNAVLVGGSNVAYSLSAKQLSTETKDSWFNFGLSSEGFTDKNYWQYIRESLTTEKRAAINLVVYSSVASLRSKYLAMRERATENTWWGSSPFGFIPKQSFARWLKNVGHTKPPPYPPPVDRGDFDFDKKDCPQNYVDKFERETDELALAAWIKSEIYSIRELFPNAEIAFVIPSEFYGNLYNEKASNAVNETLKKALATIPDNRIRFFSQSTFSSKAITCDNRHHGNFKGRQLRTQELAQWLYAK